MAVTRADKEAELQQLETAFKGFDSAILVDYKGLNVPQVTELRRQLRVAKAQLQGRQEHAREARAEGHCVRAARPSTSRARRRSPTRATDPVALAKALTTFVKTAPALTIKAAVVQGRAIKPAEVTDLAALPGKPELYARLLGTLQAPMVQLVQRAERRAARFDERAAQAEKKRRRDGKLELRT